MLMSLVLDKTWTDLPLVERLRFCHSVITIINRRAINLKLLNLYTSFSVKSLGFAQNYRSKHQ